MNFKNYFVSAALVAFGMVGCAAHNPAPVAVNTPPPPPAVVAVAPAPVVVAAPAVPVTPKDPTVAVSGEGWSLSFPNDSWAQVDAPDGVLALVQNDELHARVMLMGDGFKGSTAKFSTMVLTGMKESGGKLVSQSTVTVNGNQFIYVKTLLGGTTIYGWLIAKNSTGYVLMCGASNDPDSETTCNKIASTLHLD
jgi:glucose/arabinose dehydrogenase